ncbi:MAG: copper resistance system multicopper oxidase [Gammaproteobacteria bacterium]|nr:copper resistance system multicopper oxidase [Gammaproteobacteria bacterium]
MSTIQFLKHNEFSLSRRQFVKGLAAGGTILGLGLKPFQVKASTWQQRLGPQILRGTLFNLVYSPTRVNITGNERFATAVNGSVPGPVIRWREGDNVTLNLTNNLAEDTSIHWHGIILPYQMDGVPGISFPGVKPGETFTYKFPVIQSGTYWYHSHSGFQEQTGAYGAIIIDPKEPEPFSYDRDYVVMLSDWSDENPDDIYAKLKKRSDYYNFRERTIGEQMSEMHQKGLSQYLNDRSMWNRMRMSDRDISDVTGYTYTFLMNGVTPADGWLGLFKRGERVRLRIINASAMTFFDMRIPGLKMTVVAADGQYVQPVSVDEFRIGVAETYDVLVEPKDDRAYAIFAQAIDRSGYARGTLTPDPGLTIDVPALDPAPILTHGDMGMSMAGMGHDMANMKTRSKPMPGMDHSRHNMGDKSPMNNKGMKMKPVMGSGKAGYGSQHMVKHASTEFGPHVDMRPENPQYRIDDPGVGLRNNGRKVLTYADLFKLGKTYDPREPGREIDLHLTGSMTRYMWSMNGIKFADAEPLRLKFGERVRINFYNDTMMNHPMHLHGMWSDLETGDPEHIPRKHTVIVQPGARISYLISADALGSWAYHCHLLYHMPGMFRKVVVSKGGES